MKKPKVLTNYQCMKMIRKPVAKPSIRMKSKKDYNRSQFKKVIDIYLTENEAIASYNDATDLQSSEDSYTFDYINEDVLAKLFSRVANADQYINTLHNKQYVEELQEFLQNGHVQCIK